MLRRKYSATVTGQHVCGLAVMSLLLVHWLILWRQKHYDGAGKQHENIEYFMTEKPCDQRDEYMV
jgi:hypothetical protein